jgi:hypothetical protein
MKIDKETIARVCHEVNRVWQKEIGEDVSPEWALAPQWQKDSAMKGVDFHFQEKRQGDVESHNSWMKEKLENGWRYGHRKDENDKTHPCLLPFEYLPLEQKIKDSLFASVVQSLAQIYFRDNPKPDAYLVTKDNR